MKIVVLNGSPKGSSSVTMQYVNYIQKKFPQHEYTVFNIAQKIKQIEVNEQEFHNIIDEIKTSDAVIWAFPLYYLLACSQYKRFVELIWERNALDAFKDKYAAVITTSIHFYDHTAQNYMHAVCDDLDMKYFEPFSAEMYDLTKESERQRLLLYAQNFFTAIDTKSTTVKTYKPLPVSNFEYIPGNIENQISTANKRVVIVTDCQDPQSNLGRMITRFQQSFTQEIEVFNLHDVDIKGGCQGCMQCGYDNTCVYKDGFKEFVLSSLTTADILVFAGSIKDRYLSSTWKQFFDRTFFNNHVPLFNGKQFAYIISGPISQIPNLRQIIEGYTEIQLSNLAGIISDEYPSNEIDASQQTLARKLITYACQNYIKPLSFLHLGGKKIFRDALWGDMRFPFIADYKYYSQKGYFDFPYKNKSWLISAAMALLTNIPSFRKDVYTNRIKQEMLKPFTKILKDA